MMKGKSTFTPPAPKKTEDKDKKSKTQEMIELITALTGMINPIMTGVAALQDRPPQTTTQ